MFAAANFCSCSARTSRGRSSSRSSSLAVPPCRIASFNLSMVSQRSCCSDGGWSVMFDSSPCRSCRASFRFCCKVSISRAGLSSGKARPAASPCWTAALKASTSINLRASSSMCLAATLRSSVSTTCSGPARSSAPKPAASASAMANFSGSITAAPLPCRATVSPAPARARIASSSSCRMPRSSSSMSPASSHRTIISVRFVM
mmetsp:Transcript_17231/g.60164  ORF Transcript_17231/g.60164 Transcript_17231/m.60164 type:complete len:203 (+) Transcript_17231:619-1227(+)